MTDEELAVWIDPEMTPEELKELGVRVPRTRAPRRRRRCTCAFSAPGDECPLHGEAP